MAIPRIMAVIIAKNRGAVAVKTAAQPWVPIAHQQVETEERSNAQDKTERARRVELYRAAFERGGDEELARTIDSMRGEIPPQFAPQSAPLSPEERARKLLEGGGSLEGGEWYLDYDCLKAFMLNDKGMKALADEADEV